jgi:hypothetical protein
MMATRAAKVPHVPEPVRPAVCLGLAAASLSSA